jgi:uncharacterized RDD family membrane protein YckC
MTEHPFGGFWRRAVAAVIDQIILGFIYSILFMLGTMVGLSGFNTYSYTLQPDGLMKPFGGFMLLYHGFCILINIGYFTYFHGTIGQTPGKMAMSLKVMQVSGEEMTPGVAFLRWVGYIVSSLGLFLGYIWVAFDPRKQGWHDKIAGTVVILKKEKYLDKAGDI